MYVSYLTVAIPEYQTTDTFDLVTPFYEPSSWSSAPYDSCDVTFSYTESSDIGHTIDEVTFDYSTGDAVMANPFDRRARTITLDTVATSSGGSRNYA
jgi:hypothetical protein